METISDRLLDLRHRKGYSQEQLAELSGLNLRTIQRIEKGETIPRGDSLQRLASALEVTPDDLVDWSIREDKSMLLVMNLSQLSFLAFPILAIIIPLIIWINQKDKVREVRQLGIKIMNFQLTWVVFFFMSSIFLVMLPFVNFLRTGKPLVFILVFFLIMYSYNFLVIVVNSILLAKDRKVMYMPAFKFIRR